MSVSFSSDMRQQPSSILICDKPGINELCLSATIQQIQKLVDDKLYRVEKYSQAPQRLEDPHSNPVSLFVVPGGDYNTMAEEFEPLVPRIQNFVKSYGGGYLGICNGAIAAAPKLLTAFKHDANSRGYINMLDWPELKKLTLCLYSENCAVKESVSGTSYSSERVCMTGCEPYQNMSFNAFFSQGVFFPLRGDEFDEHIRPLLYYDYKFEGEYHPTGGRPSFYLFEKPAAAVTEKVGKGTIVLSGVHPEIGVDAVNQLSAANASETANKIKVVKELQPYEAEQTATMRHFLNTLSIATKKV